MTEYREVEDSIDVPRNAGMEGVVKLLRRYLSMPRVQDIHINARGRVTVRRYVLGNDGARNSGVEDGFFDELSPYRIARNTHMTEWTPPAWSNASITLMALFDVVAQEQLKPLAFLTGAQTLFWDWVHVTTGYRFSAFESLYGVSVYSEEEVPDSTLILLAGFGRDAALVDAHRAYKLEIPRPDLLVPSVEVL